MLIEQGDLITVLGFITVEKGMKMPSKEHIFMPSNLGWNLCEIKNIIMETMLSFVSRFCNKIYIGNDVCGRYTINVAHKYYKTFKIDRKKICNLTLRLSNYDLELLNKL